MSLGPSLGGPSPPSPLLPLSYPDFPSPLCLSHLQGWGPEFCSRTATESSRYRLLAESEKSKCDNLAFPSLWPCRLVQSHIVYCECISILAHTYFFLELLFLFLDDIFSYSLTNSSPYQLFYGDAFRVPDFWLLNFRWYLLVSYHRCWECGSLDSLW